MFWSILLLSVALAASVLQRLGPPRAVVTASAPVEVVAAAPPVDGLRVPRPALLEPSLAVPGAMLPRVGPDGTLPRVAYARPSPVTDRPRVALVLSGLGLSEADSIAAIRALPPTVTLAISPYASNAAPVLDLARAHGNELLATVPMEAEGADSAGRRALMTGASAEDNRINLEWALGRTQGYAGVTGAGDNGLRGERFAAQISSFKAMLEEVSRRGLYYLDPRPGGPGLPLALPHATVSAVADDRPARDEFEDRLAAIEAMARERGFAIALAGPPRRATVERLVAWAGLLEQRGFVMVPVSALVQVPVTDAP